MSNALIINIAKKQLFENEKNGIRLQSALRKEGLDTSKNFKDVYLKKHYLIFEPSNVTLTEEYARQYINHNYLRRVDIQLNK